jgi:hypothetical protein
MSEKDIFIEIKSRQAFLILSIIIGIIFVSYFGALSAFISPSPELRWNSSISYINDIAYNPGDTVTVTGFIEEGTQYFLLGNYYDFQSSETVRWFVIILDPNYQPIHIETGTLFDAIGNQTLDQFSFDLPINSVSGQYRVRVFVWTDWLISGDTRTYLVNEKTFGVS